MKRKYLLCGLIVVRIDFNILEYVGLVNTRIVLNIISEHY